MGISTPLVREFQAMAQAVAQGFQKYKPGPWAKKSHQNGPGLAWPVMAGFGWLLASGPGRHITSQKEARRTGEK